MANPFDMSRQRYGVFEAVIIVLLVLSTIALGLRIAVRTKVTKRASLDDYLLVISHCFTLTLCGTFLAIPYVDPAAAARHETSPKLNIMTLVAVITYCLGSWFFKICLTVFFMRISQKRWQRLLLLGSVILYTMILMAFMLTMLFRCGSPTSATLEHIVSQQQCKVNWNVIYPLGMLVAAANTATFIVFSIIPSLHALKATKLSGGARRAIIVLTILAIGGCVVSSVRIGFVWTLQPGPLFYHTACDMWVLSSMEACLATFIVSLVSLRPLLTLGREKVGRAWAHMRGREYSKDFEAERRIIPRFNMAPTTVQRNYSIDEGLVRGLGVLPDCDDEYDYAYPSGNANGKGNGRREGKKSTQHFKTMQMASISEVLFTQLEPTRRLSTV